MARARHTKPKVLPPATRGLLSTAEIENAVSDVARARKNQELPHFEVGDTVDVHTKVTKGGKERIRVVTGTVIAKSGSGCQESFTVRPFVAAETEDQEFPLDSLGIDKIEVKRPNLVPRVSLRFLSDRSENIGRSKRGKRK